jgi:KUP system potassium uptake protein
VPPALLHNLKHNQVLHEHVVMLTIEVAETPRIDPDHRLELHHVGHGFHRVILHYGFTEEIDIPRDLAAISQHGIVLDPMRTSYFLGRQKLIAAKEVAGMALWREQLFALMLKASESAMDYYRLPANRVVELGSQIRI